MKGTSNVENVKKDNRVLRKIKTLVVAPYEGLQKLVISVQDSIPDLEITTILGNLESSIQSLSDKDISAYDIIISRGGTAELLEQRFSKPVINIEISNYDLMRAIELSHGFIGKSAIVGYRNLTDSADSLMRVLGDQRIDVYSIDHSNELPDLLFTLKENGYKTIVGDVIACEMAKRQGLNSVLLTSGIESVNRAFEAARQLQICMQGLKNQNELLFKVMDKSPNRTIALDEENHIIFDSSQEECPFLAELQRRAQDIRTNLVQYFWINDGKATWNVIGKRIDMQIGILTVYYLQIIKIESNNTSWINIIEDEDNAADPIYTLGTYRPHLEECLPAVMNVNRFNLSVVIVGETGTGKDCLARTMHMMSKNRFAPMVSVDCETMMEKELEMLPELLNSALQPNLNPTLYLRKLDKLDFALQKQLVIKLEPYLIEKYRLFVSVRQNLEKMVNDRMLCESLFQIIGKNYIFIPSLRERTPHIQELSSQFIAEANLMFGKQVVALDEMALTILRNYSWPANLLQMNRVIRDLVLQTESTRIDYKEIERTIVREQDLNRSTAWNLNTSSTLKEVEENYIKAILVEEDGRLSNAAKRLGISRSTLWRKLNIDEQ